VHGYELFEQKAGEFEAGNGIAAIKALVDALRPVDDDKVRTLRSAIHELRTPLTTVAGFVEMLADKSLGPVTDEQKRVLRTVARNVQRLVELVDAMEPMDPGRIRESARP
jgi:signal transduction histidine kinase